jgi:hypothetical protein
LLCFSKGIVHFALTDLNSNQIAFRLLVGLTGGFGGLGGNGGVTAIGNNVGPTISLGGDGGAGGIPFISAGGGGGKGIFFDWADN